MNPRPSGHGFDPAPPLPALVAILAILVVALLAYANAWPNTLVYDDKYFAGQELFDHLNAHFNYFSTDVWSLAGVKSPLYRPLLLLSLALDAQLYGDWFAGYHLSNLLLNAVSGVMVFGFLRELLRRYTEDGRSSDLYALFAALLFVAHPVHAEAVNSLFNRSEMLVTIAGAGGLWWLLHQIDRRPAWAWSGFAIAYLLGLFSKENAAVLPGLGVLLIVLMEPGGFWNRVKRSLPAFWLLLPLALYIVLRAHALGLPLDAPFGGKQAGSTVTREIVQGETLTAPTAPPAGGGGATMGADREPHAEQAHDREAVAPAIQAESGKESAPEAGEVRPPGERKTQAAVPGGDEATVPHEMEHWHRSEQRSARDVAEILALLGWGMKLFVWPYPLRIIYPQPTTLAVAVSLACQAALLLIGLYRYRKDKPVLLASLAFFYLAMLPASRLINFDRTVPHLNERYLYFPSVAFAMLLAFGLRYLGRKRSRRTALLATALALAAMLPLSWVRNGQWNSDVTLFETDYLRGDSGDEVLRLITAAQVRVRNFSRVVELCDEYPDSRRASPQYAMQCAIAYSAVGREDDAAEAFKVATGDPLVAADAHANVARWYLKKGDREQADNELKLAIETERVPHIRKFREAERLILLYPRDRLKLMEAQQHLQEALRMSPKFEMAREWLDKLDKALGTEDPSDGSSGESDRDDGG